MIIQRVYLKIDNIDNLDNIGNIDNIYNLDVIDNIDDKCTYKLSRKTYT